MATTQPHWALLMVLIECEALIRTKISAQPPTSDPNATRTWFQLNRLGSMSCGDLDAGLLRSARSEFVEELLLALQRAQ